jgi:benzoyl-CoA reductase subunit D
MITAGIDLGAKTIKAVVVREGEVLGRAIRVAGFDAAIAREALREALAAAGLDRGALGRVVATGVGRDDAPEKDATLTDVGCAARGASHLVAGARTVIDVGAEEGRAIRCDARGRVVDFAVNEKCAAGTGVFAEAIARALEVSLEELGPLSQRSTKAIAMNAQCAVFAESEAVSMIHSNVAKEDMARAVHDAMASRVAAMTRRVGLEPPYVLVGGLALNPGFVDSLRRVLATDALHVPPHPEYCGALGAALFASEG